MTSFLIKTSSTAFPFFKKPGKHTKNELLTTMPLYWNLFKQYYFKNLNFVIEFSKRFWYPKPQNGKQSFGKLSKHLNINNGRQSLNCQTPVHGEIHRRHHSGSLPSPWRGTTWDRSTLKPNSTPLSLVAMGLRFKEPNEGNRL